MSREESVEWRRSGLLSVARHRGRIAFVSCLEVRRIVLDRSIDHRLHELSGVDLMVVWFWRKTFCLRLRDVRESGNSLNMRIEGVCREDRSGDEETREKME